MKKIILASKSARRKELMEMIGYDFDIIPAIKDEVIDHTLPLEKAIAKLAFNKANEVFETHPDCLVIGSDTIVAIDNEILGKPKDKDDARRMMKLLSGRKHEVITGLAILSKEDSYITSEVTTVYFNEMTDQEIEEYINTKEPYDKAGGYAIQGIAAKYIEKINGDVYTVIGLPVYKVYNYLAKGIKK